MPFFTTALRLVADAGEERLAPGVGGVHVAVEHQVAPGAAAFKSCHDIGAAFFHFLPRDAQSHLFPARAHVLAHGELFAGGAGNVDDVAAHGDDFVLAHLGDDALGDIVRELRSFNAGLSHGPVLAVALAEKTRKSSG